MKITVILDEDGVSVKESILVGGLKWGLRDITHEVDSMVKRLVIKATLAGFKQIKKKK